MPKATPATAAPAAAPAPVASPAAAELPKRATVKVRVLQAGPLGAFGQVRDDLPADWVADHINSGALELVTD